MSPATEMRVPSNATSERSTGARNASSDGDRRRRSDEKIAAEAIGDYYFSFFFQKIFATQMMVSVTEQFPQGKERNFEGWEICVWKRWWHAMKQFCGGKFEGFKEVRISK